MELRGSPKALSTMEEAIPGWRLHSIGRSKGEVSERCIAGMSPSLPSSRHFHHYWNCLPWHHQAVVIMPFSHVYVSHHKKSRTPGPSLLGLESNRFMILWAVRQPLLSLPLPYFIFLHGREFCLFCLLLFPALGIVLVPLANTSVKIFW